MKREDPHKRRNKDKTHLTNVGPELPPGFPWQKLQFIEWNCLLEGEGRVVEEPGIIECDILQFGVPVVLVSVDLVPIDLAEAIVKSFLEGYL